MLKDGINSNEGPLTDQDICSSGKEEGMSFVGSEARFPDKEANEKKEKLNKKYNDKDNIVSMTFIPKLSESQPLLPKANKLVKKLKKLKDNKMNLVKS